jgi:alkyl sulfatase BDS1-like metallo-beta-lactamase superfamily hydrolase
VDDESRAPKDASTWTRDHNAAVHDALPFHDRRDFDRVARGLIARPTTPQVMHELGFPVWDLDAFAFVAGEAPDTVNPSLWRQAQLNGSAGLFEIAEGMYQVRGLDLANVTFIAGDTGWIVIDPLTSAETARASLDLVHAHLPQRPIRAVIYTHSHIDHFAGVRGIVDEDDVRAGNIRIIAPEGFLEAAISENVIAGNVMGRRASYMYGILLPKGPRGHVDAGLGKGIPLLGSSGLIAPTEDVSVSGTELTVDGVRIVFQLTPGTEAPAEMNFFFPDRRVLCMAENCTATMHNLYTLRGAQVRDALMWSKYINESIERFAADTDVLFASHHWPRWGADDVLDYLQKQRDAYRYLHDQTMRLANHGLTMEEIAEDLALPDALAGDFCNRDYYGTVNHNAKAVYQRYLGWFDGNPANLHPLPPVDAAVRYVEYMGGADEVLRKARRAFDDGDYRWVAEVVNHVVFAEPDNEAARTLQADTLEQLGYQAESGPWRGFYLTAAQELRHGAPSGGGSGTGSGDVVRAMTVEMLLDYLAVRLNGPAAASHELVFNLTVTDRGDEAWTFGIANGSLHATGGRHAEVDGVDANIVCTHDALAALTLNASSLDETLDASLASGALTVDGAAGAEALRTLLRLLDRFDFWFNIVTP